MGSPIVFMDHAGLASLASTDFGMNTGLVSSIIGLFSSSMPTPAGGTSSDAVMASNGVMYVSQCLTQMQWGLFNVVNKFLSHSLDNVNQAMQDAAGAVSLAG